MHRTLIALAIGLFAILPAVAQDRAMPSDTEIRQILTDRIERDAANIGIAVAVIENGQPRFVSHGTLSKTDQTPVDAHTLFEAGSITKVMTNLLLAKMVVDGRMTLDAPLTDYLPPGTVLPQRDGKSITAFDLATHSAGLSGLPPAIMAKGLDDPYAGFDAEALMGWLATYDLPRPIGERFEYSNIGTALLGQALEHVSGQSFAALLQTEVFDVLGMDDSFLATGTSAPSGMAIGHDMSGEPVPNWHFDAIAPAGALVSNTTDLAKFIAAASGAKETPLKPAFDLMLERTRSDGSETGAIGLGWFRSTSEAGDTIWHNGITAGYRSFAGYDPASGNGVIVLSNQVTEAGIEDIGMHLLHPSLPLRDQPEPRQAIDINPALLPKFAGEYLIAPGLVMTITTENNRLFAQLTGQARFEIFPESEQRFFYRVLDAQITFSVDGSGKSDALMLHQGGHNLTGVRTK